MTAAFRMLLWERWRRTRWLMAGALGFSLCCTLLMMIDGNRASNAIGVYVWAAVIAGFGILVSTDRYNDLNLMLPERLRRLPVPTWMLTVSHLLYGSAAVSLLLVAGVLFGPVLDLLRDLGRPSIGPVVCLEAMGLALLLGSATFCLTQAVAWLLAGLGVERAFLFVLLTPAVFLALFVEREHSAPVLIAIAGGVPVASVWIALRAVSAGRHGGGLQVGSLTEYIAQTFGRCPGQFTSAHRAQVWFEHRRMGRFQAFMLVVLVGLASLGGKMTKYAGLWYAQEANREPDLTPSLVAVLPVLLLAAAWAAGMLALVIWGRDRSSGTAAFLLTKPMSSRDLASARLAAAGRSVLTSFVLALIVAVGLGVWTLASEGYHPLGGPLGVLLEGMNPAAAVVLASITVAGFLVLCWGQFWNAAVVLAGTMGVGLVMFVALLLYVAIFGVHAGEPDLAWVPFLLGGTATAGTVVVFWAAIRRGLVSTRWGGPAGIGVSLMCVAAVWWYRAVAGAGDAVDFADLHMLSSMLPYPFMFAQVTSAWKLALGVMAIGALCAAPVAALPLWIDWRRHG